VGLFLRFTLKAGAEFVRLDLETATFPRIIWLRLVIDREVPEPSPGAKRRVSIFHSGFVFAFFPIIGIRRRLCPRG
jgi:hypothetical protein